MMTRNLVLLFAVVLVVGLGAWLFTSSQRSVPIPSVVVREDAEAVTITLAEQNDSGETGVATLVEEDGKVTVTIATSGFTPNTPQPAHIHVGSCPDVGAVRYPLTNVVEGESVTVLDLTFAQLQGELPLGINIHKSAPEASVYTACGDLTL